MCSSDLLIELDQTMCLHIASFPNLCYGQEPQHQPRFFTGRARRVLYTIMLALHTLTSPAKYARCMRDVWQCAATRQPGANRLSHLFVPVVGAGLVLVREEFDRLRRLQEQVTRNIVAISREIKLRSTPALEILPQYLRSRYLQNL